MGQLSPAAQETWVDKGKFVPSCFEKFHVQLCHMTMTLAIFIYSTNIGKCQHHVTLT
jgi:hypothetical protein